MRLRGTRASSINTAGFSLPAASLDLRFADNKSLTDAITGQSLVTYNRASGGSHDEQREVIEPPEVIPGYHVNTRGILPEQWKQYLVSPRHPVRIFF